jgi:hypothetical protein
LIPPSSSVQQLNKLFQDGVSDGFIVISLSSTSVLVMSFCRFVSGMRKVIAKPQSATNEQAKNVAL